MSTFNTLLRKATSLLKIGGLDASPQKVPIDGEVIFCKNNVCVHPPTCFRTEVAHHPGYLAIREQIDEVLGSTLILTWIPNATLKKNPHSLENRTPESSPCRSSFSSKCPSPTPSGKSPFHLSLSTSNSMYGGNERLNDELKESPTKDLQSPVIEDILDQKSISSTISDMGSPREDYGSLDSFSNSDQTEMTASTSSQVMSTDLNDLENYEPPPDEEKTNSQLQDPKKVSADSNNGDLQSQTDSGIGPEEVIAALEKMICGLNDIDSSKQNSKSEEFNGDESVTNVDRNEYERNSENTKKESGPNVEKENRSEMHLDLSNNLNEEMEKVSNPPNTPGINVSSYSPGGSSSTTPTTSNRDPESFPSTPGDTPPPSPRDKISNLFFVEGTPESLAHAHNLSFPDDNSQNANKISKRERSCGVFSVDLRPGLEFQRRHGCLQMYSAFVTRGYSKWLLSRNSFCVVGRRKREAREAPDHHQGVLPQIWGGIEQNHTVITFMVLKATTNDRRTTSPLPR
ncbi:TBC1 domain family member 16 [Trichonephila clavipes]|nr:TBC1 domain family member 16 [Trichonephila clavipes]